MLRYSTSIWLRSERAILVSSVLRAYLQYGMFSWRVFTGYDSLY